MVFSPARTLICNIRNFLPTKHSLRCFTPSVRLNTEILYTSKHEWVKVDKDNRETAAVGISDYAQQKLGDIVYVELPAVGDTVTAGESCGLVESVKSVSDVLAPASGEVLEVNEMVEKSTSIINKSPIDKGWLFRLRLSDTSQLTKLMPSSVYKAFLDAESS